MIRKAMAAALAAALLVCASPAQAWYASIAFSPTTGEVSATHDATSVTQSETDAVEGCTAKDCKIIFTTQSEWMAIAVSNDHEYGVSGAGTREEAMEAAYTSCLEASRTCHWRLWTHNSGDPQNDATNEFDPGPDIHPNLAAIGGAFSGQIPNFKAFRQLDPKLCWAAALKTLYYNISGFELSQWKLARLSIPLDTYGREPNEQAVLPLDYTVGQCNEQVRTGCNGGSTVATANYLGILLPLASYPKTKDSTGIWRSLRRSIQAGYPAIITIDWYTGQNHALVVYGMTVVPRPGSTTGEANITLDVYDPEIDAFAHMVSNVYLPEYERVPGRFTGMITFANFLSPTTKVPTGGGKRVCTFLNSAESDRAGCTD